MGANSKIQWTHHTFNMWRGCTKVSAGCAHCYAETLSKRNPGTLGIWGRQGTRVVAAESYWKQPLKWDKAAEQAGERHRVFCASLADVFEGPETMPVESWPLVEAARERLFGLIAITPHLDWLLLTKRPENAAAYLAWPGHDNASESNCTCRQCCIVRAAARWFGGENSSGYASAIMGMAGYLWQNWPLPNLWIGTSVENQAAADERIPHLLRVPAKVRFLSCEPLLSEVNLDHYLIDDWTRIGDDVHYHNDGTSAPALHWCIVGGESGSQARPMHPAWARSIRGQCEVAGVPFFFKQHGEWISMADYDPETHGPCEAHQHRWVWRLKENDPDDLPVSAFRVGKKAAGRRLDEFDGWHEYNEVPE